jgi:hypothetical protein
LAGVAARSERRFARNCQPLPGKVSRRCNPGCNRRAQVMHTARPLPCPPDHEEIE